MSYINKIPFIAGSTLLVINAIFALYTAGFGVLSAIEQRGIHFFLLALSLFLMYKPKEESGTFTKIFAMTINILLAITTTASSIYLLTVWEERIMKLGQAPFMDVIMGVAMILVVLEATRRTAGKSLVIIAVGFIGYSLWGRNMPDAIAHSGLSIERLSNFLYLTTEGIFGIPLGISATFIVVFVIFGAFLEKFGGGKWFIDVSYALTGKYRGGPAKTSVVSSGLMGMLSGSPVANVATTGTFTVPLMKKMGFQPKHAGAIEAVASTGGMITPPIMGAAAFIMAEYLGVPYTEIIVAAILPAVLFYLALLLSIDSLAVKYGISGEKKSNLPNLKKVMKERGHLSLPLLFLITMISIGWSPMKSAFWAIILAFALGFLNSKTRPSVKNVIGALKEGSQGVIPIATACASAGIIVGVISVTGLGAKLSFTLLELSQGSVFLALLITMIITIILGFGMPPTAVYIILVAILIPPLEDLGVSPIAAHMFLFFYSTLAALTPPVAITAYTAAAIAKGDANQTGFASFRLGLLAYIIPFMFVYSPNLLLQGDWPNIVLAAFTAIIGVITLVAGIEGYLLVWWNWISRTLLLISALLLIHSSWITDIAALLLITSSLFFRKKRVNKQQSLSEVQEERLLK